MTIRILVLLAVWSPLCAETVDFRSPRWTINDKDARLEEHLGRPSLFLQGGKAVLKDANFEDGTIEVDMAAPRQRAFMGACFRVFDDMEEDFYLRPHKSGLADASQYMPTFGASGTWQLFSGQGFTAAVEIPLEHWIHVTIVVEALQARAYLDHAKDPVLVVPQLKLGYARGGVGVWATAGGAHFSNFSYTPAEPQPKQPIPGFVPPPGVIARWGLSQMFDAASRESEKYPGDDLQWRLVMAEAPGMVVIDRYLRSEGVVPLAFADPARRNEEVKGKKLVYARATVYSDRDQVKKMNLGYSDEATVFVNRKPVFTGRSAFLFRDPGFLGIMDVENDAVFVPLKRGKNELLLAVSEYFGGWGLICRFADMAGIRFDTQ